MRHGRYNRQGYFGECFVRVLASAAGLIVGKLDIDTTGVDFSFDLPGSRGTTRFPKIEAQVKSCHTPHAGSGVWHYSMASRQFNDLAGTGFQVPRFLFLVVVPSDADQYAEVDTEMLRLRHCGYWVSLADRELVDTNAQQTTTVHVPQENVLTIQALLTLMSPVPAHRGAP